MEWSQPLSFPMGHTGPSLTIIPVGKQLCQTSTLPNHITILLGASSPGFHI